MKGAASSSTPHSLRYPSLSATASTPGISFWTSTNRLTSGTLLGSTASVSGMSGNFYF